MIFPSGKARNNGFNPLTDDAKTYETPSQRQTKENTPKAVTAAEAIQQAKYADQVAMPRACSIGKAQCGKLTDMGGPVRQMRTATSNSIWNPDVLKQIKEGEIKLTEEDRIKSDNAKLAAKRDEERRNQFRIDPEAVKAAMRRADSVTNVPAHERGSESAPTYSHRVASHQISIFDSADKLDKMPDLTAGEQIKKAAAERRNKKDDSWKRPSTAMNAKQKLSTFFENLRRTQEGK